MFELSPLPKSHCHELIVPDASVDRSVNCDTVFEHIGEGAEKEATGLGEIEMLFVSVSTQPKGDEAISLTLYDPAL